MNQTFWIVTYPVLNKEKLNSIATRLEEFFGLNF